MAQFLVIDENAQAALNGLREHAEANPLPLAELQRIVAGQAPAVGDRPGFWLHLLPDVTVVYSLEDHAERRYRHLSVSVAGRMPSPGLVDVVVQHMGFTNPVDCCLIYFEQGGRAVNVLEPADGEKMAQGTLLNPPS